MQQIQRTARHLDKLSNGAMVILVLTADPLAFDLSVLKKKGGYVTYPPPCSCDMESLNTNCYATIYFNLLSQKLNILVKMW